MEVDREKRLAELDAKTSLSDAEFDEQIALSPPGRFVALPHLSMAGPIDIQQALKNVIAVGDRAQAAFGAGFFIEVLALRSQSLELYLRMFLAAKASPPAAIEPTDKRPLGPLVNECGKRGFDSAILEALEAFNVDRVVGIHKFLLGATSYESLRALCQRSSGLVLKVVDVLVAQVGVPIGPGTAEAPRAALPG